MTATVEDSAERHRSELIGLAYRMLGSVHDAEDAVQEAFVRLERHGTDGLENVGGWLNRVTSRICLDRLRAAQTRREVYVGPWLPEPLEAGWETDDPVELAESVTMAFLVVLESLGPAERIAFVLHQVFGYGYGDVAAVLDRSEAACRQLVSRARRHVEARSPRFESDAAARSEVASRFLDACRTGETERLLEVLAADVVLRSDGGGKVSAARHPVHGATRVARFLAGILRQAPADIVVETAVLNGAPGIIARYPDGQADTAIVLDIADGLVVGVNAVRNPDKLTHLHRAPG